MAINRRGVARAVGLAVLGLALALAPFGEAEMRSGPIELSVAEKSQLLALARASLRAHLAGLPAPSIDERALPDALREPAACFVTLTKVGALRGCILDSFQPHESMARNVARNAVLAATVDSRFPTVRADELDHLAIEVSVLGRPYAIPHAPPEVLVAALRPGVDGVILTTAYGTSTFLPQVWEQIPDVETFLTELCRKQGAPAQCWKTRDLLRVEIYQVNHFSEGDDE